MSLSCGAISQDATITPPTHTNTDRNNGWFSSMPFIHGRPIEVAKRINKAAVKERIEIEMRAGVLEENGTRK